jgi:hypothetical protein
VIPPREAPFVAPLSPRADVGRMRRAAELLPGRRDFAVFGVRLPGGESSVRCLHFVRLEESGDAIAALFRGDAFLRGMVRSIAGPARRRRAGKGAARKSGGASRDGRPAPPFSQGAGARVDAPARVLSGRPHRRRGGGRMKARRTPNGAALLTMVLALEAAACRRTPPPGGSTLRPGAGAGSLSTRADTDGISRRGILVVKGRSFEWEIPEGAAGRLRLVWTAPESRGPVALVVEGREPSGDSRPRVHRPSHARLRRLSFAAILERGLRSRATCRPAPAPALRARLRSLPLRRAPRPASSVEPRDRSPRLRHERAPTPSGSVAVRTPPPRVSTRFFAMPGRAGAPTLRRRGRSRRWRRS